MRVSVIVANILLMCLVVGCNDAGTILPSCPLFTFDDSAAVDRIKPGMGPDQVQDLLGCAGKEIQNVPSSWPRKCAEVPEFETLCQRHHLSSDPGDQIRWLYWRVRGKYQWVAVGRSYTWDRSLAESEVIIKKTGLDEPDFTPRLTSPPS
jgi:hypothetical protein